ncbi:MAG: hypothetical protein ONB46_13880 [candidate division KSB1 bacterium]|nr:hypothetical protein [candidate division KSB1 bacterium]MDZ7369494.1 hypothetical protein [candidate division KSB1 bacterium]MDZ7407591.1 hypothetical protein [candidate division KSB1 bacterium]
MQLIEDIEAELKWDQTFARTQDKLAKLADKALKEIKAGRVKKWALMSYDVVFDKRFYL